MANGTTTSTTGSTIGVIGWIALFLGALALIAAIIAIILQFTVQGNQGPKGDTGATGPAGPAGPVAPGAVPYRYANVQNNLNISNIPNNTIGFVPGNLYIITGNIGIQSPLIVRTLLGGTNQLGDTITIFNNGIDSSGTGNSRISIQAGQGFIPPSSSGASINNEIAKLAVNQSISLTVGPSTNNGLILLPSSR